MHVSNLGSLCSPSREVGTSRGRSIPLILTTVLGQDEPTVTREENQMIRLATQLRDSKDRAGVLDLEWYCLFAHEIRSSDLTQHMDRSTAGLSLDNGASILPPAATEPEPQPSHHSHRLLLSRPHNHASFQWARQSRVSQPTTTAITYKQRNRMWHFQTSLGTQIPPQLLEITRRWAHVECFSLRPQVITVS